MTAGRFSQEVTQYWLGIAHELFAHFFRCSRSGFAGNVSAVI
jgi:hypothetical protein